MKFVSCESTEDLLSIIWIFLNAIIIGVPIPVFYKYSYKIPQYLELIPVYQYW